ncbi:hypothetical protein F5Y19DRAFT_322923 [Xylariaceae sp. FL1651]|nr:hypothetical protein F5Y19DRAFT_322923 [Xylariaceae sp. FL1651]
MVCKEDFPTSKLAKLKCGHRWCRVCLKRRFELSISDTQHMPPKCCTPDYIPLKHVNRLFNDGFKRTWNQKFAEFSARDRIHCPSKRCRELIQPNQIRHYKTGRSSATCRGCNTRICCACYNKWHESKHCPADEETVQFLKTAKEEGWQRCYKCTAMVELKEGCNHMTCRCGAEFCMICGERWKTCECPWFNYDMVEQDELDHMPMPFPMVDRDRLGGSDSFPRAPWPGSGYVHGGRPRPSIYEEPRPLRRRQEQRDEDPARRHQHADTDEDDDYLGGMGDVVGLGNAAGHFMNNDYRRRSHSMTVTPHPPPAVPPPPPSATFERTNSATNYVSGVNKARGVRGSSMERRLADRFSEQRQGPNPSHRSFGQPIPPPPPPPLSMGPPLSPQPHMGPSPVSRRHTMTDDLYDVSYNHRVPERSMPRRAATHDYMDEFVAPAPSMRRRYRDMEPPRSSELAGLTGLGSGMNRVSEWRNHVEPIGPESHTVMT